MVCLLAECNAPSKCGHPVPFATATSKWAERAIYDAHVRSALPRARYRTPIHQDQSSLDQRPGRTNEPQRRKRQTLSLQRYRTTAPPSRRLRRRLQFRTPSEDPQRPHAIRVRLKMLDFRARPIQTQPTPSNAGTEHDLAARFAPAATADGSGRARSSPSGQNGLMHRNRMSLIRLRVDHVISADEKRRWNRYTNRLSSLQVDKKLKFRGLLNRQIGGVCSFEDPV